MASELRDEILERIENEYADLLNFIGTLDESQIIERKSEGEWSIKDILAHVTAWEEILLRFHLSGERFDEVIGFEGMEYRVTPYDEINQHLFETYRNWSLDDVMGHAGRLHKELLDRLSTISNKDLRVPPTTLVEMGYETDPLAEYISGNTYEHYVEHLETMKLMGDRAG